MNPWAHVSASQIVSHESCSRRWWFAKIAGRPEPPPGPALALGSLVHANLEHYLLTGDASKLGPIELAGKHLLPAPSSVAVELEVAEFAIEGVPVKGRIDVLNKGPTWVDDEGEQRDLSDDALEIVDFKTTSSLAYAKNASQLTSNTQMVLYAAWALEKNAELARVRLSHISMQTKGARRALKTTTLQSREQIAETFAGIKLRVLDMKRDATALSAADVAPDFKACHMYNQACPFLAECYALRTSPRELTVDWFSDTNWISSSDTKSGGTMSLLKQLNATKIDPVIKAGTPEAAAAKPAVFPYAGVNPPDAPAFDTVLATEGEDGQRHTDAAGDTHEYSGGRWSLVEETTAIVPVAEAKKRGRKAKSADEISDAPKSESVILFIHAVPNAPAKDLSGFILAAASKLAAAAGDSDVRCSKNPMLAFGAWKGALASEIRANPPPAGEYMLLARGDLFEVGGEAVAALASFVVRGVA